MTLNPVAMPRSLLLFTALFAWVFLKDAQLSMGTFLGALLIMAGVICISYFEKLG